MTWAGKTRRSTSHSSVHAAHRLVSAGLLLRLVHHHPECTRAHTHTNTTRIARLASATQIMTSPPEARPSPPKARQQENRRAHTKSRTGCLVCKRRHVKCDEGRPRCRNCTVGDRSCSYTSDVNPGLSTRLTRTLLGSSPSAPSLTVTSSSPGSATPSSLLAGSDLATLSFRDGFTALHMVLLYHATTSMAGYMALEGDMHPIISEALRSAHTAPYVLDQLLALTALHRSTVEPETASIFRHQATELQTRALGLFNEARESISEATFIPSFLFASLMGIHVLHNTLAADQHTAGSFVHSFVDYMRIHRGVRAVTSRYWQDLLCSDLKPLLYVTLWIDEVEPSVPGTETAPLRAHLESTLGLSTPSSEPSLEALRRVQWMLDLKSQVWPTSSASPTSSKLAVHAIMAWPLVVPDEYIDHLYQHRPEALAVLAFFCAALHQHRGFWVFGNVGQVLVQLIMAHVGPFWTKFLDWPQEVIAQEWPS